MAIRNKKRGKLAVLMTQVLTMYMTKYIVEQLGITQTSISAISRGVRLNPPKRESDKKRAKQITRKLEELRSAAKNGVPEEHRRTKAFAFQKRKSKAKPKAAGRRTSPVGRERKALARVFKELHGKLRAHMRETDIAAAFSMECYQLYNITHASGTKTTLVVWRERIETIKSLLAKYDDVRQLDEERDRIIDEHAYGRQVREPVIPQTVEPQRNGKFSLIATIIETSTGIEKTMPVGSVLKITGRDVEITTDEQGICIITIGG